jgi:hypothetical protein
MIITQEEEVDLVVFFWAKELENKPPAYVVIPDEEYKKYNQNVDFECLLERVLREENPKWGPEQREQGARLTQYMGLIKTDRQSGAKGHLEISCYDENMQPIARDGDSKGQTAISRNDKIMPYIRGCAYVPESIIPDDDRWVTLEAIRMKVAYCPEERR